LGGVTNALMAVNPSFNAEEFKRVRKNPHGDLD
jgi:hypothetical protein